MIFSMVVPPFSVSVCIFLVFFGIRLVGAVFCVGCWFWGGVFSLLGVSLFRDPAETASPSETSRPPQKSKEDFYCGRSSFCQG
ncbi:hypothetical protein HCA15_13575 [Listeria booriae]|uniref:hypothetical protein n=1 Tax=Listeria booriae TaxID=1552123 RepID=UPI00164D192E|nr:hypothetical protein [Listeria booriae]MBC6167680.1 hypothetical protein [Listeria booriae]